MNEPETEHEFDITGEVDIGAESNENIETNEYEDSKPENEERPSRKDGRIPEKVRVSRLPRISLATLSKSRRSLSALLKRYLRQQISDSEMRTAVYSIRAISQILTSEEIEKNAARLDAIEKWILENSEKRIR